MFVTAGKMLALGTEIKDGTAISGPSVVEADATTHNIVTDKLDGCISGFPDFLHSIGHGFILGFPAPLWVFFAATVI